jgi:SAM-dependent methyltransferase
MYFLKKLLLKTNTYHPAKIFAGWISRPPSIWLADAKLRIRGAPDGYPVPPPHLNYHIVQSVSGHQYMVGGQKVMDHMIGCLDQAGVDIKDCRHVLDFGSGLGRLLRWLSGYKGMTLYGSDLNPDLVHWCQKNLPFATFDVNDLSPPLKYADASFDLIYLRSVFTHLSDAIQLEWMGEFKRLLQDGGILLFTTHGDLFTHVLSDSEREIYNGDQIVLRNLNHEGSNIACSIQSQEQVRNHLLAGYELVAQFDGVERCRQDVHIVRKKPMPVPEN